MRTFTKLMSALFVALTMNLAAYAAPGYKTILYNAAAEAEEGSAAAEYLSSLLNAGISVQAADAAGKISGRYIEFTNSGALGLWEYEVRRSGNRVSIDAGGCWAMRKASELLAAKINESASIPSGLVFKGSVEGEILFPRAEGSDLRILSDNIWDYSKDTIPPVWQKIGVDCRDAWRAPQFAQLVRAYMPDVLNIQEYSAHMDAEFLPRISEWGYVSTTTGSNGAWNNTPIFYNKNTLELVSCEYALYSPARWSNKGSKSFTSAVFRRISDGKVFGVITTHLWWKKETAQAGSDQARAAQARLVIAEAVRLKAKYNCPIFVTGDMNCEESSIAISQFLSEGFIPCYKAATVYGDRQNGHHICAPGDGFSRKSRRISTERSVGAIDHCFIWNAGDTEVKVFDCITAYFTVPLTDHYPNLIDAKL